MYEIKWTSDLKFVNFIRKFLRWQIVAQWMDWMVCFMKNKHRCTMMRYDVLEYMFSFFFFWNIIFRILFLNEKFEHCLTFLDIIDQYYSYRIIRTRLYINETVFLEQNARTTSENYVYITMTDILWSYDDVIFVKSNR